MEKLRTKKGKYEYKIYSGVNIDILREDMNELGEKGWRIIEAELDIENSRAAVIFERKK